MENIRQITVRLKNGDDLREGIENILKENNVKAGALLSIVGSLSKATLRMPGGKIEKEWIEELEIVGGTGTLSVNGSHIHISISNKDGNVFGGHLAKGCIVRTTAEIVIFAFPGIEYKREPDLETGFDELKLS